MGKSKYLNLKSKCLNPHAWGGHENDADAVFCSRCHFLIKGAYISSYKVISLIGEGSYGHVYEVLEPAPLARRLALKVLRIDQFTDKALAQFFAEAERIAKLQHPNILPIYHFGQLEDGRPYFVMEYAKGNILAQFRSYNRTAFAKELVPYLEQTAEALNYIHNGGFIHLDVKPINLLIGSKGQIFLSDFGISHYVGIKTHITLAEAEGTYKYMPLEQLQGRPRRESDQYALAASFYHLLTGRPPFDYSRVEEMMNAILSKQPPPPPQVLNPRIPPEVGAVLLRALTMDYRYRYHNVLEFAQHYKDTVEIALKRYSCQHCEYQNQEVMQQCGGCGTTDDNRCCPYCGTPSRFGKRYCAKCGRLIFTPTTVLPNPFLGLGVQQGRYILKRVLKYTEKTKILVTVADDTENMGQKVVLKRWQCSSARFAQELIHYINQTEPLTRLQHPLVPHIFDRFPDEIFYYLVMTYIDGETLEERLQKLLKPLPQREVLNHMNILLNILVMLEQRQPPLRHYDISPANIIIENSRNRACLVGFQIPSPLVPGTHERQIGPSMTRNLTSSPYLPVQDLPHDYDQRTCIYSLAACMHYALTNYPPPHYPSYPPVRELNPTVSPAFEAILNRALMEDRTARYQNYEEMQRDVRNLLPKL